jgi:hypothetical protein
VNAQILKDIKQKVREKMNFYTSEEAAQDMSQSDIMPLPQQQQIDLNTIHEVAALDQKQQLPPLQPKGKVKRPAEV